MTEKQTRNRINREWVEKELRFYNKAHIRSGIVLCTAVSVFVIPLTVLLISLILREYDNAAVEFLLSLLLCVVLIGPIVYELYWIVRRFAERKQLDRGEFDVIVSPLAYKHEKMIRRNIVEFLHFDGYRDVSVGKTMYTLADAGDEYYLVVFRGRTDVELLYSAEMCEYKESCVQENYRG